MEGNAPLRMMLMRSLMALVVPLTEPLQSRYRAVTEPLEGSLVALVVPWAPQV